MNWTLGHPKECNWYLCVTNLSTKGSDYHTIQLWYNGDGVYHSGGGYTESDGVTWTHEVIGWAPMPKVKVFKKEVYDRIEGS